MTTTAPHPDAALTLQNPSPPGRRRRPRGEGSQRERRPGVWEVRIPTGPVPGSGRSRHVSLTVHGTAEDAAAERARLLARHRDHPGAMSGREPLPPPGRVTVGPLLIAWLAADHPWKPATLTGYRSVSRGLLADPLARSRAQHLTPQQIRHAIKRWQDAGAGIAVVDGRFRVLRSCLSWAYNERHLDTHPLRLMRGPGRSTPRRPLADDQVRALLVTAELRLLEAQANHLPGNADGTTLPGRTRVPAALSRVHRAEQDLLLVRLAADTGARRGEITALRFADLTGRTLCIERSISAGQLTTPKSGHGRSLTIGADTAALWHRLSTTWATRLQALRPEAPTGLGPWVFTADLDHRRRLGSEVLGHRFERNRDEAGVPDATLHRLRHTVATFLVSRGQLLQAQARLGHADAATTLREYSHAFSATDGAVADAINTSLDLMRPLPRSTTPAWPDGAPGT